MTMELTIYTAVCFPSGGDSWKTEDRGGTETAGKEFWLYVKLALELARELQEVPFVIITNEPYLLLQYIGTTGYKLPRIEFCEFESRTPKGTAFELAHYKIDAWAHIGKYSKTRYSCIIDTDIVTSARAYENLEQLCKQEIEMLYYNQFERQSRSYGKEKILNDIARLSDKTVSIWAGGEFLMGKKEMFKRASEIAAEVWPNYLSNMSKLRHIGDEAVLTACIVRLKSEVRVESINKYGVLDRVFTARLLEGSERPRIRDVARVSLLHLPSSKEVLSNRIISWCPLKVKRYVVLGYVVGCLMILRILPMRKNEEY